VFIARQVGSGEIRTNQLSETVEVARSSWGVAGDGETRRFLANGAAKGPVTGSSVDEAVMGGPVLKRKDGKGWWETL
jgi:hypothetical protein